MRDTLDETNKYLQFASFREFFSFAPFAPVKNVSLFISNKYTLFNFYLLLQIHFCLTCEVFELEIEKIVSLFDTRRKPIWSEFQWNNEIL